jgi:hypothetical protein
MRPQRKKVPVGVITVLGFAGKQSSAFSIINRFTRSLKKIKSPLGVFTFLQLIYCETNYLKMVSMACICGVDSITTTFGGIVNKGFVSQFKSEFPLLSPLSTNFSFID